MEKQKSRYSLNVWILFAAILGCLAGLCCHPVIHSAAEAVSEIVVRLLRLVSLPIIFLSVLSTVAGMESVGQARELGKRVLFYTLLTTLIAGFVALGLFVFLNPVGEVIASGSGSAVAEASGRGYLSYLGDIVPGNFLDPFIHSHVMGVLFLAIGLSVAVQSLNEEHRRVLMPIFSALFAAVMKVTEFLVYLMPVGIWAFVTLFVEGLKSDNFDLSELGLYLLCIVGANLIQAVIVLPSLVVYRGLSPIRLAKAMGPALSLAFFTRSTSAALPVTMRCIEEGMGVSQRTSRFSLPLCATINMNACAGFILITVFFVAMRSGIVFTPAEMLLWVGVATLGAMGNAAVPLGCYFVATAFLSAMGVPLNDTKNIFGLILPIYSLLDMMESAINVWSDACVTALVEAECKEAAEQSCPAAA